MSSTDTNQPWTIPTSEPERFWCGTFCRLSGWTGLLLVLLSAAGCGDGTVVANGRVTIEGKPAPIGRLTLNPLGKGQRAYALVGKDGLFALRTSSGESGAWPGEYHVVFQHRMDDQGRSMVTHQVAGELNVEELTVVYRSATAKPFVIPESDSGDLAIDIQQKLGWKRLLSE